MTETTQVFCNAVEKAAENLMSSDEFKSSLEEAILNMMKKAVSDALSFGESSKHLKKKIEDGLSAEIQNIEMPSLQHFLGTLVQEEVSKRYEAVAAEHFTKQLHEALLPAPDKITVQEIIDLILENIKSDYKECPCDFKEDEAPEIEWDIDTRFSIRWYTLKIWLKGKTTRNLMGGTTKNRIDLALNFREKKLFVNPFRRNDFDYTIKPALDRIYLMHAQGTVISDLDEFDPDFADICVSPYEI